jgi:DNA-binding response OmpR family regulator
MHDSQRLPDHKHLRVLVADDDPIVRSLIRAKLNLISGEVIEAVDGFAAWELVSKGSFHLAVVDLEMPNLDGFTLIQCIRSHPSTRRIPIVVVTCRDDHAALQRALEAGATSYMTKPLAWSMFNAHVKHLLRLSAAVETAEANLQKQMLLSTARHKLAAGLTAELASRMRKLRVLLDRSGEVAHRDRDIGEAQLAHVIASDIGALEQAAAQYSFTLSMLDGLDAEAAAPNRLQDLLEEARGIAEAGGSGRVVELKRPGGQDVFVRCPREVSVFVLATAMRSALARSAEKVLVTVSEGASSGPLVSIVDDGSPLALPMRRAFDAAVCRASDLDVASIAQARLLVEAQGGQLELCLSEGRNAIRVRFPSGLSNAAPQPLTHSTAA